AETAWTLFAIASTGSYFLLARKEQSERLAYATLWPLLFGFGLFFAWKSHLGPLFHVTIPAEHAGRAAVALDTMLSDYLWMAAGACAGLLYLTAARMLGRPAFAYLSASIITGACCHTILFLQHPGPEWFAVSLVPLLAG